MNLIEVDCGLDFDGWPFAGFGHVMAIGAIKAGRSRGRLFVDDAGKPSWAILWNEFDGFYVDLAGDVQPAVVRGALEAIIQQNRQAIVDIEELVIYTDLGLSDNFVLQLIPAARPEKRTVRHFRDFEASAVGRQGEIPVDYQAILIAELFDEQASLGGADEIVADIAQTWTASEAFLSDGLGVCIFHKPSRQVACYCFTEHATKTEAELSVETQPAHQRKGLAYAACTQTLTLCQKQNRIPNWYTMADNKKSIALTKKLGLKEAATFPVWFFPNPYCNLAQV